jgi:hypothetical protein
MTVNLREGMRRLALLLGVVGAILGAFASYLELQPVMRQRANHKRFEQLANSDVVKQEQNSWPLTLRFTPDKAIGAFLSLPEKQQRDVFFQLNQEQESDLIAKLKCEPTPLGSPTTAATVENLLKIPDHPGYTLDVKDDPYACLADAGDPPASTVSRNGIETIHWTKALEVDSLDMVDGQTLYGGPAPNRWLYLLIVLLPILGFFIPWGVVRAIVWVGAGFAESGK